MAPRRPPSAAMARLGAQALERVGLVGPAYSAYQRWQTWRSDGPRDLATAPDGLPLPPQRLFVLIGGTVTVESFLRKGHLAADLVRRTLAGDGVRLEDASDVLDFGVGCGRVARHWKDLGGPRIHGCDVNRELLEWVDRNLPFVTTARNDVAPPLPYPDDSMDVVYAFSVLTHLPADHQAPWLGDLRRVLRPDGRLLVSTHGRAYLDQLSPEEGASFEAGRLVSRFEALPGSNLCGTYHPESEMRRLADACGLEVRRFQPAGAGGNSVQDLWLLRRA